MMNKTIQILFLILVFCLIIVVKQKKNTSSPPVIINQIAWINRIDSLEVGEIFKPEIKISAKNINNNDQIILLVENILGKKKINSTLEKNIYNFNIPKFMLIKSGVIWLRLIVNNKQVWCSQFYLKSQKTNNPNVFLNLSPKYLFANNLYWGEISVIATDTFNNILEEGTPISYTQTYNNKTTTNTISIKNLLIYSKIFAPNKVGKLFYSAKCYNSTSRLQPIELLPFYPKQFSSHINQEINLADDYNTYNIDVNNATDVSSNKISNNTEINVLIKENNNYTISTSTIQNGNSTIRIPNPHNKTTVNGFIYMYPSSPRNSFTLNFEKLITGYEIRYSKNTIYIPPIKSIFGNLLEDGTPVEMFIINKKNEKIFVKESYLEEGCLRRDISTYIQTNDKPCKLIVSILGIEQTMQIN